MEIKWRSTKYIYSKNIKQVNFNEVKSKIKKENIIICASYIDNNKEKFIYLTYNDLKEIMENCCHVDNPCKNHKGTGYTFPNEETFNMIGLRQFNKYFLLGKINYHLDNCQDNNCNDYAHEYIKQK